MRKIYHSTAGLGWLIWIPVFFLISCTKDFGDKRLIAEYEPHDAILIGFRVDLNFLEYDRKEFEILHDWDSLNLDMAKIAQDFVPIYLVVGDTFLFPKPYETMLLYGLDTTKVRIMYQPPSVGFYQDPAPLFGLDKEGSMFAVDFQWTGYTNNITTLDSISEKAKKAGMGDRHLANTLGLPIVELDLVLEGGAIETNAQGTVILTEKLMKARNPQKTLAEIEKELTDKLNVKQVIWLPKGAAEDPQQYARITGKYYGLGTGGHTDEYVRFANDTTILLSWVSEHESHLNPIDSLNYLNYTECYNILQKIVRPDGGKFRIVKVPSAPIQKEQTVVDTTGGRSDYYLNKIQAQHGDTLIRVSATSYLNFIITNNLILAPKYFKPEMDSTVYFKDREVVNILEIVFPHRVIRQLDPSLFNYYGGGMHCRFKELPIKAEQ